jgi:hypothetical protein
MPVFLTGQDTGAKHSFESGNNWDNHAAPDAGHDYIVPNNMLLRCYSTIPFKGRSLSIASGGDFSVCGMAATVNDLRAYSDALLSTRVDTDANKLLGNLTVYATTESPAEFMIESNSGTRQLTLGASLVGGNDAMVRFRCYK